MKKKRRFIEIENCRDCPKRTAQEDRRGWIEDYYCSALSGKKIKVRGIDQYIDASCPREGVHNKCPL